MKVLLIHPKLEQNFYDYVKPAPLGLAYIAGALRNAGHDVGILDANVCDDPMRAIEARLRRDNPQAVGVSVCSSTMRISARIARLAKTINSDTQTIFGGVHPTLFPADVARETGVDYVVHGEGDDTIVALMQRLERAEEPDGVQGVAYERDGEVVVNDPRPLIEDLDRLPIPAYDLLPIGRYFYPRMSRARFMSMVTTRGCPYGCVFCASNAVFGKRYRFHSPERTIREMTYLIEELQIREILFLDSDFVVRGERVERLCDLMIERKIRIPWICNGRAGRLHPPLLQKMKRAGCRMIGLGVESGDQAVLDRMQKRITVDQIRETFRNCRRAGIKTAANWMIGNPGDTRESIRKTVKLVKEIKPDTFRLGYAVPLPGTELCRMARENGWLLDNFDPLETRYGECVMNATNMTTDELKAMMKWAYRSVAFSPGYIRRRFFTLRPVEWEANLRGLFWILKLRT
jgi:radical SAM superfamily enzyme YgiQ (UPF0313 family)